MNNMEFCSLREMLIRDRSIRRFKESDCVEESELCELVELTRYCASGRNMQPLAYRLVTEADEKNRLFETLKWAGYLSDWDGPKEGERPAAYIVQCLNNDLAANCLCDDGLHLQAITLGAVAKGLGCCIIKSFDIVKAREALVIPDKYSLRYVVAIGKPIENVEITDTDGSQGADIRYYRTSDGTHVVPKRPLHEILI